MTTSDFDVPEKRGSLARLALVLVPLAIFAALAVLFYIRLFAGDPSKIPSALIGKAVPEFTLPALEGYSENGAPLPGLTTADLKGRVTVVNVWASWCVPCRDENPMLLAMERQGIPVMGINYKDRPENARRFLTQFGNPFERIGNDRNGRVSIDWGVYGVPETFVVDASGAIVHKHVGPFTAETLEAQILPAIEKARNPAPAE